MKFFWMFYRTICLPGMLFGCIVLQFFINLNQKKMKPFYCTLKSQLSIMVIPDADAHMDGHPVLTYSYTLYKSKSDGGSASKITIDHLLSADKIKNPNYLGTIYFDQPDKAFSYTSEGAERLEVEQVQEIIEEITRYRKNPAIWRI